MIEDDDHTAVWAILALTTAFVTFCAWAAIGATVIMGVVALLGGTLGWLGCFPFAVAALGAGVIVSFYRRGR